MKFKVKINNGIPRQIQTPIGHQYVFIGNTALEILDKTDIDYLTKNDNFTIVGDITTITISKPTIIQTPTKIKIKKK